METLACQLTQYHLQYKQLKISPLNAHEKRKIYREIVMACNSIEKTVDEYELFLIEDQIERDNQHTLRKLILSRLDELRTKSLRSYNKLA